MEKVFKAFGTGFKQNNGVANVSICVYRNSVFLCCLSKCAASYHVCALFE